MRRRHILLIAATLPQAATAAGPPTDIPGAGHDDLFAAATGLYPDSMGIAWVMCDAPDGLR